MSGLPTTGMYMNVLCDFFLLIFDNTITGKKVFLVQRLLDHRHVPLRGPRPLTCGCFNVKAGLKTFICGGNMKLLQSAGHDAEWYSQKLDVMLKCISDPECDHAACAHHKPERPPKREILVTCPFHLEILTNALQTLKSNAHRLIDKELGRVHNNEMELGFSDV